jgi:hypothetical protein
MQRVLRRARVTQCWCPIVMAFSRSESLCARQEWLAVLIGQRYAERQAIGGETRATRGENRRLRGMGAGKLQVTLLTPDRSV